MCEPTTMMAIGLGTQVLGTGVQVYAQGEEKAAREAMAFEDAKTLSTASFDALNRGERDAQLLRMKGSQAIARMRASAGASGVDVSNGTPASVMESVRLISELDAQTARNNAAREAWGYRKQASRALQQAEYEGKRGTYEQAGTILGGTGQALGSFGNILKIKGG